MKAVKVILPFVAIAAITVFIYACQHHKKKVETAADETVIPVKLVQVGSAQVTDPVSASGFVSSETEARLSFKTGGVIQKIYVQEGQLVHKGQVLATLNLTEINGAVEQAKLGVEKAQRDYDRAQNLYKDTVATLESFQNATTGLNVAKQQYEIAKFNSSYSEIRAQNDGVIVKKLMNEGEIVSPGLPVFYMTAAGANDWVVKVGIADKDWARLALGNTADVKIDAYPDENFTATVSKLSQAPDQLSGLYQAELKLNGSKRNMATGLFAKAEIKPTGKSNYISIPVDAVIEGNGHDAYVYVADGEKAKRVPVKTAFIKDGVVMVTSGLSATAQVITDGSAYLTDGTAVQIVK